MSFPKLKVRVLAALCFGPPIIIFSLLGRLLFLLLIDVIIFLSMKEFFGLAERKGASPLKPVAIFFGLVLSWDFYLTGSKFSPIIISVFMLSVLLWELYRRRGSAILNISTTFLGFFYIAFLLSYLIQIRELPRSLDIPYISGGRWIFLILIVVWTCDTAAYFVGSRVGRHQLSPKISPKKTVEGAVAGFLASLLFAFLSRLTFIRYLSLLDCLVIGFIVGLLGQFSDLVESLFKRDAGVKDASSIIPGHGGVLDRFDTIILIAPVIYFYLRFFAF